MKIAYIGTYPPRECGIGTFTRNLFHAVASANSTELSAQEGFVVALNDYEQVYSYPEVVKLIIQQEQQADYIEAANFINLSGADCCVLEHEFGIFGGQNGETETLIFSEYFFTISIQIGFGVGKQV